MQLRHFKLPAGHLRGKTGAALASVDAENIKSSQSLESLSALYDTPEDDEVREVPRLPLVGRHDGGHSVRPGVIEGRPVVLHPAITFIPMIVAAISSNLY